MGNATQANTIEMIHSLQKKREHVFIEIDLLVPKTPKKNSKQYFLWSHFSVLDFYTIVYERSLGILQNFFHPVQPVFLGYMYRKTRTAKPFPICEKMLYCVLCWLS